MAKSRKRRRKRRRPAEHSAPQLPGAAAPVAERTETREKPPPRSPRRAAALDERPPAPWGSFPLQELTVLVALIMLGVGFVTGNAVWVGVGLVLGSLGGLELACREHFGGYRSHTVLLAGTAFVVTVGILSYFAGLILLECLIAGAVVFVVLFLALRRAFRRASGGLSFRIGGLRG
jgi:hypothetical protein